ncbi:hypothetical protein ACGCUP_02970 [Eubacteriales bacterium KG125]
MTPNKWLQIAEKGRVSQAYIVEGLSSEEKENFVVSFVEKVILRFDNFRAVDVIHRMLKEGNYADFFSIEAETGLSIKKEQIDKLQRSLARASTENSYKFAVIKCAHLMTLEAQNSFLKTLEEPPGKCIIFLLTNKSLNLLQTIRSRCGYIWLGEQDLDICEDDCELIEQLREGRFFYKTKELLLDRCKTKEESLLLLDSIEKVLHEDMLRGVPLEQLTLEFGAVSEARDAISRRMSVNNAMGIMMLKFGGFDDEGSRDKI